MPATGSAQGAVVGVITDASCYKLNLSILRGAVPGRYHLQLKNRLADAHGDHLFSAPIAESDGEAPGTSGLHGRRRRAQRIVAAGGIHRRPRLRVPLHKQEQAMLTPRLPDHLEGQPLRGTRRRRGQRWGDRATAACPRGCLAHSG